MSQVLGTTRSDQSWAPLFVIWFVSLVATLGSLFFSEVMGLPPCVLCWYQRICMYPLVAISTVALLSRDTAVARYIWPLAAVGLSVGAYHNLLYYGITAEAITPCVQGVSCTSRQIEWLGFVTIPLMSLTAFATIVVCLAAFERGRKGWLR
jgi:disulfide bond formation protein DsbB